jgi:NAD(P)-dependent dehydrogenase (short-subunit alcohol dehydrogenase family)
MRTAVIAGASRGIGREVACTLASEEWHVLSGVRDSKSAPSGTQIEIVHMADPASIEALAKSAEAAAADHLDGRSCSRQ